MEKVMAALSISLLASFFSDEQNSLTRGENHYQSNDIESFPFSDGVIHGEVHASMKKKVYKVTVSDRYFQPNGFYAFFWLDSVMLIVFISNTNISKKA